MVSSQRTISLLTDKDPPDLCRTFGRVRAQEGEPREIKASTHFNVLEPFSFANNLQTGPNFNIIWNFIPCFLTVYCLQERTFLWVLFFCFYDKCERMLYNECYHGIVLMINFKERLILSSTFYSSETLKAP